MNYMVVEGFPRLISDLDIIRFECTLRMFQKQLLELTMAIMSSWLCHLA